MYKGLQIFQVVHRRFHWIKDWAKRIRYSCWITTSFDRYQNGTRWQWQKIESDFSKVSVQISIKILSHDCVKSDICALVVIIVIVAFSV